MDTISENFKMKAVEMIAAKEKLRVTRALEKAFQGYLNLLRLGVEKSVIRDFYEGTIHYSEPMNIGSGRYGVLYWVKNDEELLKKVEEFEKDKNCVVYHIIKNNMEFGECYAFLYIDDETLDEGLGMEWQESHNCFFDFSWVWNKTTHEGEFGSIGFKPSGGGLIRTY